MTARCLIAVITLVVSTGCASVQKPTLANRFVRQGTPSVNLGGPRPVSGPRQRRPIPPPPIATNVSRMSSSTSLESTDPALRTALGNLLIAPTTQHYLQVADAYRQRGVMDKAHEYLAKGLEVHGADPAIYDAMARLWRDWGGPAFGLADAHRAVYLAPQSAAARNTLGTLLYRMGKVASAEAEFKNAVALDQTAWYALANLCHISMAQGRTREAIVQCHQAEAARKQSGNSKQGQKSRP